LFYFTLIMLFVSLLPLMLVNKDYNNNNYYYYYDSGAEWVEAS